jgi:hypothetical protein
MSLGKVVVELVETEGATRLERGLGLRYTSMGPSSGIFSLSRKGGKPPSITEAGAVMIAMTETLPPHTTSLDDEVKRKGYHKVIRITVDWLDGDEEEE